MDIKIINFVLGCVGVALSDREFRNKQMESEIYFHDFYKLSLKYFDLKDSYENIQKNCRS